MDKYYGKKLQRLEEGSEVDIGNRSEQHLKIAELENSKPW